MSGTAAHETIVAAHRIAPGNVRYLAVTSLALAPGSGGRCRLPWNVVRGLGAQPNGEHAIAMVVIVVRRAFRAARTWEEQNMRRGMYRILGTGSRPNDVRVDDGGISVPVEEEIYLARGYQPPVGELPWEEDYLREHPPAKH